MIMMLCNEKPIERAALGLFLAPVAGRKRRKESVFPSYIGCCWLKET
jgi:hypothetical protein